MKRNELFEKDFFEKENRTLSQEQINVINAIKEKATELDDLYYSLFEANDIIPKSRPLTGRAKQYLELSVMLAVKAVSKTYEA